VIGTAIAKGKANSIHGWTSVYGLPSRGWPIPLGDRVRAAYPAFDDSGWTCDTSTLDGRGPLVELGSPTDCGSRSMLSELERLRISSTASVTSIGSVSGP
jgi:hypothetical protein